MEKIQILREEIIIQDKEDLEFNQSIISENLKKESDKMYIRNPVNQYRKELSQKIDRIESSFLNKISPYLNDFLNDLNDIIFYDQIGKNLQILEDEKIQTDNKYSMMVDEIINDIKCFLKLRIEIGKLKLTKEEIIKLIRSTISQMGYSNIFNKFEGYFNKDLKKIISNNINEYCYDKVHANVEVDDQFDKSYTKNKSDYYIENDLKHLVYSLCYMKNDKSDEEIIRDLGFKIEDNRSTDLSLFYIKGDSERSLKLIAEYLRESLFYLYKWLYIELKKKDKDVLETLKPIINCVSVSKKFVDSYYILSKLADSSNYTKATFLGGIKHVIPKELFNEFIEIIKINCTELDENLKNIIWDIQQNLFYYPEKKFKTFLKKINIVYEVFYDYLTKIMRRLGKLE